MVVRTDVPSDIPDRRPDRRPWGLPPGGPGVTPGLVPWGRRQVYGQVLSLSDGRLVPVLVPPLVGEIVLANGRSKSDAGSFLNRARSSDDRCAARADGDADAGSDGMSVAQSRFRNDERGFGPSAALSDGTSYDLCFGLDSEMNS